MNRNKDFLPQRERNRRRVSQRIIAEAAVLFAGVGYHLTTLDDIAVKAEVSITTLTGLFPTKESLLLPYAAVMFETRIKPRLADYMADTPGVIPALRFLFMLIPEVLLSVPDINAALRRELAQPNLIQMQALMESFGFIECISAILRAGQQRGEARADIAAEQLARYVAMPYLSILYRLADPTETASYVTQVDTMLSFVEAGLRPQ